MSFKCCSGLLNLIHITIITLRQFLCIWVYLCPCLGIGVFILYLCDLIYIFSLIFIVANYIMLFNQTHVFFAHFLECLIFLDYNVNEKSEYFSNSESSASGCCFGLIFLPISAWRCLQKHVYAAQGSSDKNSTNSKSIHSVWYLSKQSSVQLFNKGDFTL